jgi:hypothetical protein
VAPGYSMRSLRDMGDPYQHVARVSSEINGLEHHGPNRCLDAGLPGYLRCVGYGVLSPNLHLIRRELLAQGWARAKPVRLAA